MLVPRTLFLADGEIVAWNVFFERNNLANFNASPTPLSHPILAREVKWRLQVIIEFSDICYQDQHVSNLFGYHSFRIIDI